MQLLGILWFFNQIIVVINQKSFNFQTILYTCIMCVIKVQIIGLIYNHCDDLIKVLICKQHCCKVVKNKQDKTFFFGLNLSSWNAQNMFGQRCHVWKLPFMVMLLNKKVFMRLGVRITSWIETTLYWQVLMKNPQWMLQP
jgi:hypothetical protein